MIRRILCVLILFIVLTGSASALRNPAAVYCEALGYHYRSDSTPLGDVGKCILPNGEAVNGWDFFRGEVALEYSYCAIKGYEAKHVEREDCKSCLVCVLPDGREVEVTELMGLSFEETVCGDGVCGIPENYSTCPQDCHSGDEDGYCDAIKDGICDPDCLNNEDVDCTKSNINKTQEKITEITTERSISVETPSFGFEIAVVGIVIAAALILSLIHI